MQPRNSTFALKAVKCGSGNTLSDLLTTDTPSGTKVLVENVDKRHHHSTGRELLLQSVQHLIARQHLGDA